MNFKSFKEGQEVDVYCKFTSGFTQTADEDDENTRYFEADSEDTVISGEVTSSSEVGISIKYDKNGRTHYYSFPWSGVVAIHTSELNESGKKRSEEAKARFSKIKKKNKK